MYSTQREGGGDYKVVFGKPFFGRHWSGHSMGGEGVDLSLANNSIFSQRRSSLFLILSLAKNPMDSHGSTRHRCLYMYMYIINKEKSYRRTQLYAYSYKLSRRGVWTPHTITWVSHTHVKEFGVCTRVCTSVLLILLIKKCMKVSW